MIKEYAKLYHFKLERAVNILMYKNVLNKHFLSKTV